MGIPVQTEKQFMGAVLQYARLHGWRAYHTHDSRRSAAGFPDLVLVRGGRCVFAELKVAGGRFSLAQEIWLKLLGEVATAAPSAVAVYRWTPADWPEIERVLGAT